MTTRLLTFLFFLPVAVYFNLQAAAAEPGGLPQGFVYLEEYVPSVEIELRYYTKNNFVGRRIDGYEKHRCILTGEAAEALKGVQQELRPFGLGLKVFDAYRPQRAVDHFVRWAKDLGDTAMKATYYPRVRKGNLFNGGYIAARSGHTRGSTVDLTIISLGNGDRGRELDMGTTFDFFGPESWPDSPSMSVAQRAHRLLLQTIMQKHGFKAYSKEWWHFTLKEEPFPHTYFDFPVQ